MLRKVSALRVPEANHGERVEADQNSRRPAAKTTKLYRLKSCCPQTCRL